MTDKGATEEGPTKVVAIAAVALSDAAVETGGEEHDDLDEETEEREVQRVFASAAGLPIRVTEEESAGAGARAPPLLESATTAIAGLSDIAGVPVQLGTDGLGDQKTEGNEQLLAEWQQSARPLTSSPAMAVDARAEIAPSFPTSNGMAAAAPSTGDDDGNTGIRSPLLSSSPAISSEDATQSLQLGSDESDIVGLAGHSALMRLNELASGKPSIDPHILQVADEQEFRNRVEQLAVFNQIAPESSEITSLIDTLLPVVRELNSTGGGGSSPMPGASSGSPGVSLTPADSSPARDNGFPIRAPLSAEDEEEELLEVEGEPEVMSKEVTDERVVVARHVEDAAASMVAQIDRGATVGVASGEAITVMTAAISDAAAEGAGEENDDFDEETEEETEVHRAFASAARLPVRVTGEQLDGAAAPLQPLESASNAIAGLSDVAGVPLPPGTYVVGQQKTEGDEQLLAGRQQAVRALTSTPPTTVGALAETALSFPKSNGLSDMAPMPSHDAIGEEDDDVAEWDDDEEDDDDDVDEDVEDEEEVEEGDYDDEVEDDETSARPPAFNPLMTNPRSAGGTGQEGAGMVGAANGNISSNPVFTGGSTSGQPTRAADPAQTAVSRTSPNPGGSGAGVTGGAESRTPTLEPAARAVSASSSVGGASGDGSAGGGADGRSEGAAAAAAANGQVRSLPNEQQTQTGGAPPADDANDQFREKREKLQSIRVKLLRVAKRLGRSARDNVVAQVLYRLELAEQLRAGRSLERRSVFAFDRAAAVAEEQEAAAGADSDLDFTCTIMLLGKTGVGKSATINSIFDQPLCSANAFLPETKTVREVVGTVHGIQVRVIDTPALQPSMMDQRKNEQVMASVKRFVKKRSPDIVLYVDRLDMQSRDYGDLPLLKTITDTFGPSVWFNAIVVLTHASAAPPEGSNGQPISYEMYVAQRSHVVQQTIRQVAGDMRLMNPVALVENHPNCRTNRAGQKVLPNGQVWRPHLLLLCFASKILAEANSLLNLQESSSSGRSLGGGGGGGFGGGGGGRGFGARPKVPPLPFLLSSLITSRPPRRSPYDDAERSDEESDSDTSTLSSSESEDEEEGRASQTQEGVEEDEAEEREAKERKMERSRRRAKRRQRRGTNESQKDMDAMAAEEEDEENKPKQVAVPAPDPALPPSFDSDNPAHRYRFMESASQWLVRPIVENHGWDHDSGIDGFSLDKAFMVKKRMPANISGQITKDKKDANLTLEMEASVPHDEWRVTTSGFDVQTVGKDLAFTLRSETRFQNLKNNKTVGGLSMSMVGGSMAGGLKLEDRLKIGKRLKLVMSGGVITGGDPGTFVRGRGDVAYGGNMEVTITTPNPEDPTRTTIGLSMMDWRGDVALGGNLQTQFVWGKAMMVTRANLNSRGQGQISIRTSSNELLQIALLGLVPMLKYLFTRNQDISPEM